MKTMEELLDTVREIALRKADGHYTILAFTTNYKSFLGTYDSHDIDLQDWMRWVVPPFATLRESLLYLIEWHPHADYSHIQRPVGGWQPPGGW